jgi:hypothetical protein
LFLIGSINPDLILTFKRTKKYTKEDYELICRFMGYFQNLVTTPNILTEVNNLSTSLADKHKILFYKVFLNTIKLLDEHYIESGEIADKAEFKKFGLTDSTIFYVSQKKYLLITDDFPLSQYIQSKNYDAINFNHIRMLNWK